MNSIPRQEHEKVGLAHRDKRSILTTCTFPLLPKMSMTQSPKTRVLMALDGTSPRRMAKCLKTGTPFSERSRVETHTLLRVFRITGVGSGCA